MSKTFLFKFLLILSMIGAVTVWVISISAPDMFKGLTISIPSLIIAILTGGWGISFLIYAFTAQTVGTIKKFYILVSVILLLGCALTLIDTFLNFGELWLPAVVIAGVAVLLLSLFVTKGKKWDHGDNQSVGYKSYHERKAEQEKAKAKNSEF